MNMPTIGAGSFPSCLKLSIFRLIIPGNHPVTLSIRLRYNQFMLSTEPDSKDITINGCPVHLAFHPLADTQWSVKVTVRCGVGTNEREESFETQAYSTRERAEQEALQMVTKHLGINKDRNTSRVNNWE